MLSSLPYLLINEVFENTSFEIYDTASWKKKSCVPLSGHPNRMTRIVEMVYIFAKTPDFKANKKVSSVSKTGQKYFNTYYNFIEAKNNDGKVEGHEATFSTEFANYFSGIAANTTVSGGASGRFYGALGAGSSGTGPAEIAGIFQLQGTGSGPVAIGGVLLKRL